VEGATATRPPRQGEVYLVLPARTVVGRFAEWLGIRAEASPGVVVSPDESNALMREVTVAPLVTGDSPSPFRVPCSFQGRRGHVVLNEMDTVPVDRLGRQLGALDSESLRTVVGGLRELFGD